jgi:hypothetical protein
MNAAPELEGVDEKVKRDAGALSVVDLSTWTDEAPG